MLLATSAQEILPGVDDSGAYVHTCRMSKDAEKQPPPVPKFAKTKGPGEDFLKGIPHLDDDAAEEAAVSHKCDVAGCHTYGHMEYYRRTYENDARS
jgi:hypothetical protein